MPLAIFDLDETLIAGDSDHLWGEFITERGLADAAWYRAENDRYYLDYKEGRLDVHAYLRFVLSPLKGRSLAELKPLQAEFLRERIEPILLPKALFLLEGHRKAGDTLLIITATNELITAPIAARLGVQHLIASGVELKDGVVTGEIRGEPSFKEGKVKNLQSWMAAQGADLKGSIFYSDSRNDLPLLSMVDRPVAVDADATLAAEAKLRGWPTLSLR